MPPHPDPLPPGERGIVWARESKKIQGEGQWRDEDEERAGPAPA